MSSFELKDANIVGFKPIHGVEGGHELTYEDTKMIIDDLIKEGKDA